MKEWWEKYATPENICANCKHRRCSHLDQPDLKYEAPDSDRGWCVLPEGQCIFMGCPCKGFVEPKLSLYDFIGSLYRGAFTITRRLRTAVRRWWTANGHR